MAGLRCFVLEGLDNLIAIFRVFNVVSIDHNLFKIMSRLCCVNNYSVRFICNEINAYELFGRFFSNS